MVIRTRDALATTLERLIVSGQLAAGELLPSERVLAEEYGLSRSMVREALRTLAERRLIDVVAGRGSFVRQASTLDAAERLSDVFDRRQVTARSLIEARKMVETTAAHLAAERGSPVEVEAIGQALVAFERADTLPERVRLDLAFHLAVVRAAGNPLIETMFRAIQRDTLELMIRSLTDEAVTAESVPYHRRIRDAICAGQSAAAADAMFQHLDVGIRSYGDDIDRNLDAVTRQSVARFVGESADLDTLLGAVDDE